MFATAAPLWVCLFFLHLSSKWDSWKKPCLGFIRAMMRACQLFWAAISKGASYQGRQNLRGKGGFSPPPPDFGRIRYILYWLPPQIFRPSTGSTYHHLCMALKYCHIFQKMYDVLHPKNMLILVVKNFGEGCKIIFRLGIVQYTHVANFFLLWVSLFLTMY